MDKFVTGCTHKSHVTKTCITVKDEKELQKQKEIKEADLHGYVKLSSESLDKFSAQLKNIIEVKQELRQATISSSSTWINIPQIPTYDGSGCWKSYITHFDSHAKAMEWDDQEKRKRFLWCLRGKALDFCCDITGGDVNKHSYEVLVERIEAKFGNGEPGTNFLSSGEETASTFNKFMDNMNKVFSKVVTKGSTYVQRHRKLRTSGTTTSTRSRTNMRDNKDQQNNSISPYFTGKVHGIVPINSGVYISNTAMTRRYAVTQCFLCSGDHLARQCPKRSKRPWRCKATNGMA